jgi:hypothetical protein
VNEKQLGDMHHAAVAVEELGGDVNPRKVARRLKGFWGSNDVERARTALLAAEDHRILKVER